MTADWCEFDTCSSMALTNPNLSLLLPYQCCRDPHEVQAAHDHVCQLISLFLLSLHCSLASRLAEIHMKYKLHMTPDQVVRPCLIP